MPGNGIDHFFTKVVGVTKGGGRKRQKLIEGLSLGQSLVLDHERDNPVDPNAIRVLTAGGDQIGYLSADLAKDVVRNHGRGIDYAACVVGLTGGTREAPSRGVNLLIVAYPHDADAKTVQAYAARILKAELGGRSRASRSVLSRLGCALKLVLFAVLALMAMSILGQLGGRR